jgi:hypothetical protein
MQYTNEEKIEVQHIRTTGDLSYEIDIRDTPVDIVFSFTNVNEMAGAESPEVSNESVIINGNAFEAPRPNRFEIAAEKQSPITRFNRARMSELLLTGGSVSLHQNVDGEMPLPRADTVGQTVAFGVVSETGGMLTENATCRAVKGPVDTAQGARTLNIWVADNCWETGGSKKHLITAEMLTSLGERFLKAGSDNDIYDWVTTILGPEWGDTGYSNLISADNEITILLSDIFDDNSDNGGTVGYFAPVNNYTDTASGYPGSNERIMFVVDAVMYANPSDEGYSTTSNTGWAESDYWPKVVYSTLAHEFQHMIHFYQKYFLENAEDLTELWIEEMCSMLVEDFLASEIGVEGPRGVAPQEPTAGSTGNPNGRIPLFNQHLFRSPIVDYPAEYALEDYSVAYALGAWLARNYGGVDFLARLVHSPQTDKRVIEEAVRAHTGGAETFEHLLERWGSAIFLSDTVDAPEMYRYNSGGWFSSDINGIEYTLGSINVYNYSPDPEIPTSVAQLSSGLSSPGANIYLLAEERATGRFKWDIEIPEDVRLTVIFKGK